MTITVAPTALQPQEQDWMDSFLVGFGPSTRSAYATDLRSWAAFCAAVGVDHRYATRSTCDAFSRHQTENLHMSTSTLSRRLSALHGYFQYGVSEGYIDRNPVEHIRRPRQDQTSQSTGLTKEELAALADEAYLDGPQAYALVLMLSRLGLRVSEAINTDWSDISSERNYKTLTVTRKGGNRTVEPISDALWDALLLLSVQGNSGPIFVNYRRERMDRFAAWKIIKRLAKRALGAKGDSISPHSLRHTFCTLALDAGAQLHDVQDAMAHADPRTTQRYNRARHRLDNHPTFLLDS